MLQPLNGPHKSWQSNPLKLIEALVVISCSLTFTAFVIGIGILLMTGSSPGYRDIISFWAAGHQIVRHANPYDSGAIFKLERLAGLWDRALPLIMRNPPSALCLVMPLGLLTLQTASLIWSVLLIASLILSVHMLWTMHGRPRNLIHLLGYSFAPALTCILGGQTALFALLGLVLFLRLHRTRPFAAGAALWLCALKPHLFLPFAAVLILWVVLHRRYTLLAGTVLALGASSLAAWLFDPQVWPQYLHLLHSPWSQLEYIPCLSIALRFAVRPQALWLQYVPAAAGSLWGVVYFWNRREAWSWMQNGALLMLVSVLVSPYGWLTDQTLLIPALLLAAYRATRAQIAVLALVSLAIEIGQAAGKEMHSPVYLWTAPFWLLWYLYVCRRSAARGFDAAATPNDFPAQSASAWPV